MLSKKEKNKIVPPRVFLPKNIDELPEIIDAIVENVPVIVNVLSLESKDRYRIIDFLSGYVFALNGCRDKLEDCIYTFYLSNVNTK